MKWIPRWFRSITDADPLIFHRIDWKRNRTLCGQPTARFTFDEDGSRRWDRELGHVIQLERAERLGRACRKCESSPRADSDPPWV